MSAISSACSPVSGCEISRSSTLTPSFSRVLRVERVLGVDERRGAAELLDLGDDLQRQRGLARRFRPVDLDHAAARQAADAERDVEPERAGRDDLDVVGDAIASPRRMTEPLPNCFSIWLSAADSAFLRFSSIGCLSAGRWWIHGARVGARDVPHYSTVPALGQRRIFGAFEWNREPLP